MTPHLHIRRVKKKALIDSDRADSPESGLRRIPRACSYDVDSESTNSSSVGEYSELGITSEEYIAYAAELNRQMDRHAKTPVRQDFSPAMVISFKNIDDFDQSGQDSDDDALPTYRKCKQ